MLAEIEACLAELSRLLRLQADALAKAPGPASLSERVDGVLKTVGRAGLAGLSAGAAVILVVMTVNAAGSHSVIIEAFDVPKALAEHGLSKQVVAETILDALNRTQAATRLAGGKLLLTEAWNEPLKLDIPHAGISVGELRDLLHEFLGHDIHVTGELVQAPGADPTLTIRGTDIPARQFPFNEKDHAKAALDAAEYVYGTAEPVAFATYLLQQFRMKDGLKFVSRTYASIPLEFRPALALLWAKLEAYSGDFARAVELDGLALKLDPYYWPAWEELAQDKRLLEGPESELAAFQAMHAAAARAPLGRRPRLIDFRLEDNLLHDQPAEIRALKEDRRAVATGTEGTSAWFGLAMAELGRHGYGEARRYMDEADPDDPQLDEHLHDVQAGLAPPSDQMAILEQRDAADRLNWANEANEAYRNMIPDGPCALAIAYAKAGRRQEALATLARVENQNPKVGCGGNAGIALDFLGDHGAADQAFASAIARAPSLPDAYEQRGEVRLRRKDWAGAATDFEKAHQRSRHWADPMKYWGDALVGQGRPAEALAKYNAAVACAPEWPELLDARTAAGGGATAATGDAAQACAD